MKVVEEEENPASGNGTTSEEEEEECEKVDILDPERKVGNINDLPEELLLEILLCLQPTILLEVCYIFRHFFTKDISFLLALCTTIHIPNFSIFTQPNATVSKINLTTKQTNNATNKQKGKKTMQQTNKQIIKC